MYDHVGLKVKDLKASVDFYTAALRPFGHVLCSRDDSSASFGPKDQPELWLYPLEGAGGCAVHLALRAPERSIVDRFHKQGLEAGRRDHGAPGVREDYSSNYYAAFLIDPDGNNVEAVCTQ
jgi:catechol 2,3-dioxygenase-like lactoylglutathione lyase family enzyme